MAAQPLPSDPVRPYRAGRRWRRVALACGTIVLVLFAALAATLLGPVLRDPTAVYANRPHLKRVESQAATRHGASVVTELRLVADTGLSVELAVRTPDEPTKPRPAVLILGGKATGRDAARLGANVDGVVVAALSYPYAGDPKRATAWRTRQLQRALLDTVPAIQLATDYLLAQPYVDANRFELIGVSLGAFLVSPAAVFDERIRRLWLVHGAGRPAAVIEYALRSEVRHEPLRRTLAVVLNLLAGGEYLAAERWVGRMSPRPVVVINARDDERLPRASVEMLHAALRSPYRIIWMDGPHVQPDRQETIDALRALILECVSDEELSGRDARACPSAAPGWSPAPPAR